jgi:DNA polymerase bacteriophage-type
MSKIHLDFESRSRVDIWEVGAWAYSVHPSTEVLCLAYAIDDQDVQLLRKEDLELLPPFKIEGNTFHAFNSFFEYSMWTNIMVKKWGWPRIPIKNFRCVMSKSLASAYPQSLKNACEAVNTPYKKSIGGHTLMLKMSKPNLEGGWNEKPEDFEKLYQYCIDDVLAERSLDEMLPDLIPSEQTIWFLDQLVNQRGITIDTEAVKKALVFIQEYTARLNNLVFQESGGALDNVTRRQAVLDWCRSQGVEIPGYTKSDVTKVLGQELPSDVRTILEAKLQLGKTSVAKYQALQNATTEDGRLRDTLIYHGASTGRWTGKLFQLHNLPKGNVSDTEEAISCLKTQTLPEFEIFYPDVMGTLSSCIRGMIISAFGTNLFVGDYNVIEARVAFWLAGEEKGLKQFANNEDLYVAMAKRVYNKELINKKERELGKTIILGCGYGMGKVKFEATCASRDVIISPEMAERSVNMYRETYLAVKNAWYAQEVAVISTVRTQKPSPLGLILWYKTGNNLHAKLPSGRCLNYPDVSLDYTDTKWDERKLTLHYMAVDSKTHRWQKEKTYGGKLFENLCQAVARDILSAAMLRLEKAGYPVVFSVHDEIVCEVPENKGNLTEFKSLLEEIPPWAKGLPLKAEVWAEKRYRK